MKFTAAEMRQLEQQASLRAIVHRTGINPGDCAGRTMGGLIVRTDRVPTAALAMLRAFGLHSVSI